MRRWWMVIVVLFCCAGQVRAELRVFEPRHASAEILLPAIEPLMGPYESVTVYQNSLVVNAGDDTLARVAQLIGQLDQPLRNLLISLRRRGDSTYSGGGVSVEGTLRAGDVRVTTTRRPANGSEVTVRTERRIQTRERDSGQSIRALEGSTVSIHDGQLVALGLGGRHGPRVAYTELEQGFEVSARVTGGRVILDVLARDERLEDGSIRTGGISSSLSGALGEWISVGGGSRNEQARIDGTGTRSATSTDESGQYEIRVELSP